MSGKIKIAIDAMGGENAPDKIIDGISKFVENNKSDDYKLLLYGDANRIDKLLTDKKIIKNNIEILNTQSIVSDDETPLTAIKNSKNSSMWKSIESQTLNNADISLSAGNTGVLLVISRMILKTMDEINKPALAALWPNQKGMNIVLDLGANIECDENNLIDFAEMGSALYKSLYPNDNAKVALLNIGSEEIKGTDTLKKYYQRLSSFKNNDFIFNGYIEGNKIMDGDSNVIVTDGFTGNIALKTAEGTAKFITSNLKLALQKNIFSRIGSLFSYKSLQNFKNKLDPRKFNGAIFLGLKGPVVKSHGATDYIGFYHSIDVVTRLLKVIYLKKLKIT